MKSTCSDNFISRDAKYNLRDPTAKVQARPGFFSPSQGCQARGGLGGEAITMYYVLDAGFGAALERFWPGSMLGPPDLVRTYCFGLGLGF